MFGNKRLGPRRDNVVFGPNEDEPTTEEIVRQVEKIFKKIRSNVMHYRNGREAKNGDMIVGLGNEGRIEAFGVLQDAEPGNDYCNGNIVFSNGEVRAQRYACLVDCLHVDDVAAILKEKGLEKRPVGK